LQPLQVKKLAFVAVILMAGCATSNSWNVDSDPKLAQLEKKRLTLDASEKRCIDEAQVRSRDKMAGMAASPDASVESQPQEADRDREISQCRAWADQENANIAEQERNEYELQAQQERSRALFMAVITTSGLH
jgi:hypothetical protein